MLNVEEKQAAAAHNYHVTQCNVTINLLKTFVGFVKRLLCGLFMFIICLCCYVMLSYMCAGRMEFFTCGTGTHYNINSTR